MPWNLRKAQSNSFIVVVELSSGESVYSVSKLATAKNGNGIGVSPSESGSGVILSYKFTSDEDVTAFLSDVHLFNDFVHAEKKTEPVNQPIPTVRNKMRPGNKTNLWRLRP